MKKLLSLILALLLVLTTPLTTLADDEGDIFSVPDPTQEPIPMPAQEPAQNPTQESEQTPTQEPTQEPEQTPTQEPTQEPEQAPTQEPTQEPEQTPAQEPTQEPTQEPEPEPETEPMALPAPTNLCWNEAGDIAFDTVTPETSRYMVEVYRDGQPVKQILMDDVPSGTPSLMIPADQVLGDPGEYAFEVVALGFDEWLDSDPAVSPPFQYDPEDSYAGLDPISTLVAKVEAGEMTIQEARSAFLAMSAREIAGLLLDTLEAVDALSALEALYMQAAGIGLDIDAPEESTDTRLTGIGLNAWESPQSLRLNVTAEPEAEQESTLVLSFTLEAVQPDSNPAEPCPSAAISPVYVTLPIPEDVSSTEVSLTNPQNETVLYKIRDHRICFVIASLGEYQISNWIPAMTEEVPVFSVPLGGFLIIPDALEDLASSGDEPWEWQPPEGSYLLQVVNDSSTPGETWISEDPNMVVALQNGVVSTINVGETIVTRMDADGQVEAQVVIEVTPVQPKEMKTPYNRVLPSGTLDPSVPLEIAPAAGINRYSVLRTSNISDRNKADIALGLSGLLNELVVNHSVRIPNRVSESIEIRRSNGPTIPLTTCTYSTGIPASYSIPPMTVVLPALPEGGPYSLAFLAYMSSPAGYATDFIVTFYVENGKAYFAHEYADSCNLGVLAMLNAGTVPDDIGTLLAMGADPVNTVALTSIQNMVRTLAGGSTTQYGKALAIYEWIANNIDYDYGTQSGNPYRTYTDRRGTSDGFATLATLMLHYAGIKSVSVIGYAGSNPSSPGVPNNHQWNAVQIDGVWRFMDAAWDFPLKVGAGRAITYKYFLPTTQLLSFEHRASGIGITMTPSPETPPKDLAPIEAFVTRLYVNVLGRQPELDGLLYYRDILASGTLTGGQVSVGFYFSPEFDIERNPMTDAAFVTNLYNTYFGRAPEADGLSYYLGKLNAGATRTSLLYGFIMSPEFASICNQYGIVRGTYDVTEYRHKNAEVTIFVSRLYKMILRRTNHPKVDDIAALENWCRGLILKTESGSSLIMALVNSAEFTAINATLSDASYVTMMYEATFGVLPSSQALTDWTRYLAAGATRSSILNSFLSSPNFDALCRSYGVVRGSYIPQKYMDRNPLVTAFVARMYRLFLSREPEASGLEYYCQALLTNRMTGNQVAQGFVNSPEFQGRPLTHQNYIEIMYNGLLDRPSESAGMAFWLNQVSLHGRPIVFNGFIQSPEWKGILASYGIR